MGGPPLDRSFLVPGPDDCGRDGERAGKSWRTHCSACHGAGRPRSRSGGRSRRSSDSFFTRRAPLRATPPQCSAASGKRGGGEFTLAARAGGRPRPDLVGRSPCDPDRGPEDVLVRPSGDPDPGETLPRLRSTWSEGRGARARGLARSGVPDAWIFGRLPLGEAAPARPGAPEVGLARRVAPSLGAELRERDTFFWAGRGGLTRSLLRPDEARAPPATGRLVREPPTAGLAARNGRSPPPGERGGFPVAWRGRRGAPSLRPDLGGAILGQYP